MKGYADLSKLDHTKGGIPETGRVNKNRSCLLMFDDTEEFRQRVATALQEMSEGKIDSITIDVKKRKWV